MKNTITITLDMILKSEGYYSAKKDVFDLNDGAGWTHRSGLTEAVVGKHRGLGRSATFEEMEAITMEEISAIFEKDYWIPAYCHLLPEGVDICVADMAYNAGAKRSVKLLQKAIGVTADGAIGPITLGKIKEYNSQELIKAFTEQRISFYKGLKTWDRFGKGWTNRAHHTEEIALGSL